MVDTPSSLPSFTSSASFPFEGHLRVKRLDPPVASEPSREGEEPASCASCNAPDSAYIWVSDRWRVRTTESPSGLPMVINSWTDGFKTSEMDLLSFVPVTHRFRYPSK